MSIRNWIEEQQKYGLYTFSFKQLKEIFPHIKPTTISNELGILAGKGMIMSPYKGYYSVVLPHYQLRGIIPPVFYIDQLMQYIGRPYYIALLSAAELHGAAHQRPQRLQVFTKKPDFKLSEHKNDYLRFYFRRSIPEELVWRKNSETDTIAYASPELTAADIVQFPHLCGGLSNVATVLYELLEVTNFNRNFEKLYETASTAALQRLGYIMDIVLDENEQANTLYENLKHQAKNLRKTKLNPESLSETIDVNEKWKVIINQEIEIDEL